MPGVPAPLFLHPACVQYCTHVPVVNIGVIMEFNEASDRLTACKTLGDVAREAGVSDGLIRQARLDPESSSYRTPPAGWQQAIAKLARERAGELVKLAEELEA